MLKRTDGEVTLMYSEEAGTQILQQQDSLTDYNPLQSTQQDRQQDRQHNQKQDQQQDQQQVQDQQQDSAESVRPSEPRLQAFTLLEVSRTLWIPRRGGDVMVIELQSHGDELRGRVTAVLTPPGHSSLG
ncbi:leucine-rich repeat serine/threonine-protein kinase 1-like [Notothenia coriiceps]|uniref:Leucine-rich repeat serine/threonine-protein kinase 1-like n=1 Tax=Notothenia coriiceps TaxID=8208 RepID=A0A6I9N0D7_9TELE|nr:PREDICTED: leucine-rich repeat serine/threonine-protein kinase 1-like [Notothenia coriiceps]